MGTKEAFYDLFTDDPVNWIKWGAVFVILILGYVAAVPLYKKIYYHEKNQNLFIYHFTHFINICFVYFTFMHS